eukprot:TRINITY_DN6772_c0_g1_i2.p1 TRINITY_DN6772_c0_g1~~TRINITY_DN6772_c0_g1_i2.p1  ORF type:complete len:477 (+),score=166.93 TRINITY_DN6772_c0_g1_i2:125-1555(+)
MMLIMACAGSGRCLATQVSRTFISQAAACPPYRRRLNSSTVPEAHAPSATSGPTPLGELRSALNRLEPAASVLLGSTAAAVTERELEGPLEIKDAKIIFEAVWTKVERKYGRANLRFPKEVIWLMGAPGSGKSFNAPFILKARGITARELVMSSLLVGPEAQQIKADGGMVGDSLVLEILLEKLLQPQYSNGVVVDGFPRTKVQVECITMLRERMKKLREEFIDSEHGTFFRRPAFRVAVLFVNEKDSVERQLHRGHSAIQHNQRVLETGLGQMQDVRPTDTDESLARRRYEVFKDHYSTLQSLASYFTFHVINTNASVDEVRQRIMHEFKYQSSLELAEPTCDLVSSIPVASALAEHARQNLVRRLDEYQANNSDIFQAVVQAIKKEFVPIFEQHSLTGQAFVLSENSVFNRAGAIGMVIDILTERGFFVSSRTAVSNVPTHVDLASGAISYKPKPSWEFRVRWSQTAIRQEDDD